MPHTFGFRLVRKPYPDLRRKSTGSCQFFEEGVRGASKCERQVNPAWLTLMRCAAEIWFVRSRSLTLSECCVAHQPPLWRNCIAARATWSTAGLGRFSRHQWQLSADFGRWCVLLHRTDWAHPRHQAMPRALNHHTQGKDIQTVDAAPRFLDYEDSYKG